MTSITRTGAEHEKAPAVLPSPKQPAVKGITALFVGTGIALFFLFMLAGIGMRTAQAGWINLNPDWFYRFMTIHGAGMFVAMMFAMMGAMYYSLSPTVVISKASMIATWVTALIGGVTALFSVLIGNFGGAWTFLYPLPLLPAGGWTKWSAVVFLIALVFVSLSWAIYMLEVLYRLSTSAGGLWTSFGLTHLFDKKDENPPTPSVIAASVVAVVGLIANMTGMVIVMAQLVVAMSPKTSFDPLWAKNLTYFFGHTVMNLLIYMAAALIYMLIPRYTGREWKTNRIIIVAWLGVFVAVTGAYAHHLYMDFVQPRYAGVIAQIASSVASLPLLLVTGYSALVLIWGSRYRWTIASSFLYLGFVGWVTGGIGAVVDSLIRVNATLHNTVWVPAHFHSYLLMGVALWAFSLLAHLAERRAQRPLSKPVAWTGILLMLVGGYTLIGAWYIAGSIGVPRRWAIQPEGSHPTAVAGSIGSLIFLAGVIVVLAAITHLFVTAKSRPALAAAGGSGSSDIIDTALDAPLAVDDADEKVEAPGKQNRLGIAAIIIFLIAFSPPIANTYGAKGLLEHHLVHTLQYGAGILIGLWLAARAFKKLVSTMPVFVAAILLTASQALMMLLMAPATYKEVADSTLLHMGEHLVIAFVGVLSGIAAARFGKSPAWFVSVLGVTAALFWAVGNLS